MKIVNREEFLKIDKPVLYCKIEQNIDTNFPVDCWLRKNWKKELCIKDATISLCTEDTAGDWRLINIALDPDHYDSDELNKAMDDMRQNKVSYEANVVRERDGLFEYADLFLVYEDADIIKIINLLASSLSPEGQLELVIKHIY